MTLTLYHYFEHKSENVEPQDQTLTSLDKKLLRIETVNAHYVSSLRKLNSILLPVSYSDRLYRDVLEISRFSKIALYKHHPIGAVTGRMEDPSEQECDVRYLPKDSDLHEYHLYLMTLGVLSPYRRLGVGTAIMNSMIEEAKKVNQEMRSGKLGSEHQKSVITALTLHVQFNNTLGMEFYSRQGFETVKFIENYYYRIEPKGAYLIIKKIDFE